MQRYTSRPTLVGLQLACVQNKNVLGRPVLYMKFLQMQQANTNNRFLLNIFHRNNYSDSKDGHRHENFNVNCCF